MSQIHEGKIVRMRPVTADDLAVFTAWHRDSEALGGFNAPALYSVE